MIKLIGYETRTPWDGERHLVGPLVEVDCDEGEELANRIKDYENETGHTVLAYSVDNNVPVSLYGENT